MRESYGGRAIAARTSGDSPPTNEDLNGDRFITGRQLMRPAIAGHLAPRDDERGELSVLLLVSSPAEEKLSRRLLRKMKIQSVTCRSFNQLVSRVKADSGPAVIAAERLDRESISRLLSCLDQQPEWSDLPLILLLNRDPVPEDFRALVARPHTEVLRRPMETVAFTTAARAAVEIRSRQYVTRKLIRRMRGQAAQLQRLWLQLTDTEERERQRLAELLHDDLQQVLVAANYKVGMLRGQVRDDQVVRRADGLSRLLDQAIEKSRRLARELYPPVLNQQHGVGDALSYLADQMHELHGLEVELDLETTETEGISAQQKVFLFRCAQEFLFNVVKHAETKEARLRLLRGGKGSIELHIEDQGCGFASGAADSIHDPATGLGLLGIRERARALGGGLQVVSSPGQGTIVTLSIPTVEKARPAESPAKGADQAPMNARAVPPALVVSKLTARRDSCVRVLLADDHKVMRSGLRALLDERRNVEVVAEAGDGAEAVELADHLQPEVIVMDVAMPRMSGIEATRRIKERYPHIRIVGLTMFDDRETHEKMIRAGAEQCLAKTVPGHRVVDAVLHASGGSEKTPAMEPER